MVSSPQDVRQQNVTMFQVGSLLVIFFFLIYLVYQRLLSPLAKVPGPFLASVSRLWLAYQISLAKTHELYPTLHRQYGPVVRIAPNEVSTSDPDAMRRIYSSGSGFSKSNWYSVWQGRRVFDIFGTRDQNVHRQQRAIVSPVYTMKSIQGLEKYIDNAIEHFLQKLGERRSDTIDMGEWIQYFAFDVIGELTFSKRFGLMDVGDQDGSLLAIKNAITSASWLGHALWLYWLDDYLSPIFGHWAACQARHGKIRSFTVREITARQNRGSDHDDVLGKLLAVHQEKPELYNMAGVTSVATSNAFAGSDTTAASARAVLYYLLRNPEYQQRLEDELMEAYKCGKLSQLAKRTEVEQLPFFMACMWEGLRMHPQPGLTMPRVVPAGGIEVAGHFVPQGAIVGCSSWVIHKNRDIFGTDADTFNPDRWLKGNTADMHKNMLTFGYGSRTCIGKNIAETEIIKLVPSLFLHFHLRLNDPLKPWKIKSNWFALQEEFYVNIKSREALGSCG